MAAQLICNQWVAGSTPVTSSKKKSCDIPLKQRRVSWDFCFCMRMQNARKVRQKCDKSHKTASSATVCAPVLYALPYITRLYNGAIPAPAMGWERYLIPTLYTRVSVRPTTPTKKVSASTQAAIAGSIRPTAPICVIGSKLSGFSTPSKLSVFQLRPLPGLADSTITEL